LPRHRLRRPLRLSPLGTFVFTPKTVSVDVSDILPGPGVKTLHVGRGRGALEVRDPDSPPTAVDPIRVVAILEILDQRRKLAGEPAVSTLVDPRVLENLRRQARALAQLRAAGLPFDGRPRQCFETTGRHPGESLWIATDTGDALVERRDVVFEGDRLIGDVVSRVDLDAEDAIDWLVEEGLQIPPVLLPIAGKGRRGSR
jgi:hypothetical protein